MIPLLAFLVLTQSVPFFVDQTAALGLSITGDGACWCDLNNDGFPELCAGGFAWQNHDGKSFSKLGDVGAVVAADFDNDGFNDLFSSSRMKLYHNYKGQAFSEFPMPAFPKTSSRGACWGDFNGDGFVDLFVGGFEDWEAGITYPSLILMNDKGKSFHISWTDAQFRTRGVTTCDFDQDHDLDIYASNYRLQPNLFLINNGSGTFQNRAKDYGAEATSPGFPGGHSIGAAWGDFNNDGLFDLFAGNFAHVDDRGDQPKSRFLKNLGRSQGYKFADLGTCGVFYQESYASPSVADFDNDGFLDLHLTTVYPIASFGKPNFPVLYRNNTDFQFMDVTQIAQLDAQPATYQSAWADFDRDGDLDLVTSGKLFVNQGNRNNWIEVALKGNGKRFNKSAIGAQVRLRLQDKTLSRQVEAGTGEGNQNDLTLHFGLGAYQGRIDLEIVWPDGKVQRIKRVHPNKSIRVVAR